MFGSRISLNRHIRETHERGPNQKFACNLCDASYVHKRTLDEHMLEKHAEVVHEVNEGKFHCDECDLVQYRKAEELIYTIKL
jgi:transcription elongation factor Elf1